MADNIANLVRALDCIWGINYLSITGDTRIFYQHFMQFLFGAKQTKEHMIFTMLVQKLVHTTQHGVRPLVPAHCINCYDFFYCCHRHEKSRTASQTMRPVLLLFPLAIPSIIWHHMPDIRGVDVFFHRKPCTLCMASQPVHHVNDAGRCVLYLFYFLALPFDNPFYLRLAILLKYYVFARKSFLRKIARRPVSRHLGNLCTLVRYPTVAVVRYLHGPNVRHVLRLWRFRAHDEHTHPYQSVSDDPQSGFRLYQPVYRSHR